jgi:biopolymer transport protein ExbD
MRKTFLKKKKMSEDMALQITSMADIFMILLVFLLKSYSTSMTTMAPTARMALPEAPPGDMIKETLKLEIAQDVIVIDDKPVLKLRAFEFNEQDMKEPPGQDAIYKRLIAQRSLKPTPNMDPSLVVMADQKTPYATLQRVVASAAMAGFVDLQLVIVEGE